MNSNKMREEVGGRSSEFTLNHAGLRLYQCNLNFLQAVWIGVHQKCH
jgi:hypothetical protein